MSELIGPLGLPGALVALFAVFFLGLKIKNELGGGTKPQESSYTLADATQIAAGTSARIDLAERAIQENVSETRHAVNNNLEKVIDRLADEMQHQTQAIIAAIDSKRRR